MAPDPNNESAKRVAVAVAAAALALWLVVLYYLWKHTGTVAIPLAFAVATYGVNWYAAGRNDAA